MFSTPRKQSGFQPNAGNVDKAELEHIDEALDEALEESFPASDPVAIIVTCIHPSASSSIFDADRMRRTTP